MRVRADVSLFCAFLHVYAEREGVLRLCLATGGPAVTFLRLEPCYICVTSSETAALVIRGLFLVSICMMVPVLCFCCGPSGVALSYIAGKGALLLM